MLGIIKWYDPTKGYGFVSPHEGGSDIFLHRSQLDKARITTLQPDDRIEFEAVPSKNGKGDQAVNIKLISN